MPKPRNQAVDVYRGLVMLLMMAEVLRFAAAAKFHPSSTAWQWLAFNQTHVEWTGMSLHDMIQPSFTFLAGVALPYSIQSRLRKGESFTRMLGHTLLRSLILIALGIALRPWHAITFEDTLTQIGLGYTFAFLIAWTRPRTQWLSFALILIGYWLAWALYPLPPLHFDYAAVGVPPAWQPHLLSGFAAHWNKNANLGQAFDLRFLNLFPRTEPFRYNRGGYLTLSFIPTLGTMLLGLIAGRWSTERPAARPPLRQLLLIGAVLSAAGLLAHLTGLCPIVKRIWTPAWVLWSGGLCMITLAALNFLFTPQREAVSAFESGTANDRRLEGDTHSRPSGELRPKASLRSALAYPFIVVGANSIAAYLIAELLGGPIRRALESLAGHILTVNGSSTAIILLGALTLAAFWLILWFLYRRRLFLRI